jgi:processive 1,2-diacylglycerol beta-glucosyltransferase
MVTLKNKLNGQWIGSITDDQLQFLIDQLEEESKTDQDYWLNSAMIEIMQEKGADKSLIDLLRNAIGDNEDLEIIWSKS